MSNQPSKLVLSLSLVRALRTVGSGSLTREAYTALLDTAEQGLLARRQALMRASIKFYALVGGLLALALAPFIIWLGQMTFAPAIITAVVLLALGGLGGSLVALDRKPWLP